ncbi:MAG TPA: LytR C-terminal domain-containing protein [Marmoricola sp.]
MTRRRLTAGVTLTVAALVLCVMAVWGLNAATAPIDDDGDVTASTGPTCAPEDQTVTKFLRRGEVTVSVYNAGKRSGRAQATLGLLEEAGFKPGEVGNAPDDVDVRRAAVYATDVDDLDARLVAAALGTDTRVVATDLELGPGVDVMIGDRFNRLAPDAPRRLELPKPETTCD